MTASTPPESEDGTPRTPDQWAVRLAGGIAMLLALTTLVVLRIATGLISLLDALAQVTLELMPLRLFAGLMQTFQTNAKAALLLGMVIVITVLGMVIAPLLVGRATNAVRGNVRPLRATLLLAAFGLGFLFWAITQRENVGFSTVQLIVAGACVVAAAVVYSYGTPLLAHLLTSVQPASGDSARQPRRRLVLGIPALLAVISIVVLGREIRRTRSGGFLAERRRGELSTAITPTDAFYRVSSNFRDPTGDGGDGWRLTVEGMVDRPLTLTLAELKALAGPDLAVTLNCISNEIGGPLISTGQWSAAPLAQLLQEASPQPGVVDVVFEGRDGYSDSVPIQKAMAPECHIAWGLNGEPLNDKHGAPARALIPGIYGIKIVKWLERITLVNQDYRGYWQDRGWTDDGTIKPISRIDVPVERAVLSAGTVTIGGIAWAGVRGVQRVEVSVDHEATWQIATLTAQPGPYAWVIWQLPWMATRGTWDIVVRLIDGTGAVQPNDGDPPLPDGASGWHRISVGVI